MSEQFKHYMSLPQAQAVKELLMAHSDYIQHSQEDIRLLIKGQKKLGQDLAKCREEVEELQVDKEVLVAERNALKLRLKAHQADVERLQSIVLPIGEFFAEGHTNPVKCFKAQDEATEYYKEQAEGQEET